MYRKYVWLDYPMGAFFPVQPDNFHGKHFLKLYNVADFLLSSYKFMIRFVILWRTGDHFSVIIIEIIVNHSSLFFSQKKKMKLLVGSKQCIYEQIHYTYPGL